MKHQIKAFLIVIAMHLPAGAAEVLTNSITGYEVTLMPPLAANLSCLDGYGSRMGQKAQDTFT